MPQNLQKSYFLPIFEIKYRIKLEAKTKNYLTMSEAELKEGLTF